MLHRQQYEPTTTKAVASLAWAAIKRNDPPPLNRTPLGRKITLLETDTGWRSRGDSLQSLGVRVARAHANAVLHDLAALGDHDVTALDLVASQEAERLETGLGLVTEQGVLQQSR